MPIDFPASPSLNQLYTYSGRTWKWNGTGWQLEAGFQDGSATAPGIGFVNDPDTGLFRPAANVLGLAAGGAELARLDSSGGYLRMAAGTGGIQFNGDTLAANALDDYEEGTWTPTVVGSTTAGTATYSIQSGIYRKIGTLVHISLKLDWTSGTGTGSLQVGGLPFNVNTTYPPVFSVLGINVALTASNVISGFSNLTAGIQLVQTPVGGGADATVLYDAAGSLYITGTYVAA